MYTSRILLTFIFLFKLIMLTGGSHWSIFPLAAPQDRRTSILVCMFISVVGLIQVVMKVV